MSLNPVRAPASSPTSSRTGQTWSTDFTISVFLFAVAIVLAVKILSTMPLTSSFDDVKADATQLSDMLMTAGIPANWTSTTVIDSGLLTDGQLDLQKWSMLSSMPPSRVRSMADISSSYLVTLTRANSTGQISPVAIPCSLGANLSTGAACTSLPVFPGGNNIVKVSRIVAFNGTLLSLTVYAWGS